MENAITNDCVSACLYRRQAFHVLVNLVKLHSFPQACVYTDNEARDNIKIDIDDQVLFKCLLHHNNYCNTCMCASVCTIHDIVWLSYILTWLPFTPYSNDLYIKVGTYSKGITHTEEEPRNVVLESCCSSILTVTGLQVKYYICKYVPLVQS